MLNFHFYFHFTSQNHTYGHPPNLAQPPIKNLIGSIVISLSRWLPNDKGPGPRIFPRTATAPRQLRWCKTHGGWTFDKDICFLIFFPYQGSSTPPTFPPSTGDSWTKMLPYHIAVTKLSAQESSSIKITSLTTVEKWKHNQVCIATSVWLVF